MRILSIIAFVGSFFIPFAPCHADPDAVPTTKENIKKVIKKIIVEGNKFIKKDAILRRMPYKEGEEFDAQKTAAAIHRLYALGYFRQVKLEKEDAGDNTINLYVVVEERKLLEGVFVRGE